MPLRRGVLTDEKPCGLRCIFHSRFTCEKKVLLRRCFLFYDEALDYIRRIEADGSDYGTARERELLDLLGAPDAAYPIIHVAGTNGKGSVSAMLTSVLVEAGYRVGTYVSPAVLCYNERFLLDGKPLSCGKVAEYMTEVRLAVEGERGGRSGERVGDCIQKRSRSAPTAFEQETALAFLAFARERCDVVVAETGLGGRADATNAVREKCLAVITKIGLDHCGLLGDTLAAIAGEKAGIIRGAAVTCPQEREAADVLYPLVARVSGTPRLISRTPLGQRFEYDGEEYVTGLQGDHQLLNAALVIDAVRVLREKGFDIPQAALKEGLERAVWHARFEVLTAENCANSPYDIVVPYGKTLVLDGAHNPQGAGALADTLGDVFPKARVAAVIGVLADKDYEGVLRRLLPLAERVYAVTPDSPRALGAECLKACAERVADLPVEVCADVREGVGKALASDAEVTVVCGSLTLFHEIARMDADAWRDAGCICCGDVARVRHMSRRGVQKPDNA